MRYTAITPAAAAPMCHSRAMVTDVYNMKILQPVSVGSADVHYIRSIFF